MLKKSRCDFIKVVSQSYQCFEQYKLPGSSGAKLPGMRSVNGVRADSMEAYSRLMPALAALDFSSTDEELAEGGLSRLNIRNTIAQGILAGTDPSSIEYWGDLSKGGQIVCEAADVAFTLWLSKNWIFDRLTESEQSNVENWLSGALAATVPDNNWHLFIAQIGWVLHILFDQPCLEQISARLVRVREFSRDDGLFHDGPAGNVDGYSAWGFHYHLGLLQFMGYSDAEWSRALRLKSGVLFLHLISPHGWPVFGRSIHYRTAITASLAVSVLNNDQGIFLQQIRRANEAVWSYFLDRRLMESGRFTQGYWGDDVDLLEGYAGPASPLWCLRSIIPLFILKSDHEFWSGETSKLPIELSDFNIPFGQTGKFLNGCLKSGVVKIVDPSANDTGSKFLRPTRFEVLKSMLRGIRYRPSNHQARYKRTEYYSDRPFFIL